MRVAIADTILILITTVLLVLMFDPFRWNMNSMTLMLLNGLFLVVLIVFAAVIWRGFPQDEREDAHLKYATSRLFLFQTLLLGSWVLVQSFTGTVDYVLLSILFATVVGKSVLLAIYRSRN